jgi:hypothetical protein
MPQFTVVASDWPQQKQDRQFLPQVPGAGDVDIGAIAMGAVLQSDLEHLVPPYDASGIREYLSDQVAATVQNSTFCHLR